MGYEGCTGIRIETSGKVVINGGTFRNCGRAVMIKGSKDVSITGIDHHNDPEPITIALPRTYNALAYLMLQYPEGY